MHKPERKAIQAETEEWKQLRETIAEYRGFEALVAELTEDLKNEARGLYLDRVPVSQMRALLGVAERAGSPDRNRPQPPSPPA